VADVLVPIERVTTVPAEPVLGDIERAVVATGFSRYPLRAETAGSSDTCTSRTCWSLAGEDPDTPVPVASVRALPEVPANAKLDEALAGLRRSRSHLARAVGPGGATVGVVALEDLVEEYVGTVRDATHVSRAAAAERPA
jgi:Hemolysins and related proteins containing CBS domains